MQSLGAKFISNYWTFHLCWNSCTSIKIVSSFRCSDACIVNRITLIRVEWFGEMLVHFIKSFKFVSDYWQHETAIDIGCFDLKLKKKKLNGMIGKWDIDRKSSFFHAFPADNVIQVCICICICIRFHMSMAESACVRACVRGLVCARIKWSTSTGFQHMYSSYYIVCVYVSEWVEITLWMQAKGTEPGSWHLHKFSVLAFSANPHKIWVCIF